MTWPPFPFGGTFKPAGGAEGTCRHIRQHRLYDLGKECKCLITYTLMSFLTLSQMDSPAHLGRATPAAVS